YTSLTLVEEEYDKDKTYLDQNNEKENMINNNPIVLITISRSEERISAKAMHDELQEYAEDGKIEREDVPKFQTIQN
ncbi:22367_t:CDS:2, partial [Racocetra persica]